MKILARALGTMVGIGLCLSFSPALRAQSGSTEAAAGSRADVSRRVEELRADLREITRKIRPDWDLTDPKLKEAWEQGRKEQFFPYRKR